MAFRPAAWQLSSAAGGTKPATVRPQSCLFLRTARSLGMASEAMVGKKAESAARSGRWNKRRSTRAENLQRRVGIDEELLGKCNEAASIIAVPNGSEQGTSISG